MLEHEEIPAARRLLAVAVREAGSEGDLAVLQRLLAEPRITRLAGVRDIDRSDDFRTLKRGIDERGRWVAIIDSAVIGSAPTLKELLANLKTRQLPRLPLIHRVD